MKLNVWRSSCSVHVNECSRCFMLKRNKHCEIKFYVNDFVIAECEGAPRTQITDGE